MHKKTGKITSGFLFLFWLILVVLAIPQLLSEIKAFDNENPNSWTEFQFINYITYFTLICVMFVLNCFADDLPRKTTLDKPSNPSPEQTRSFLNRILFLWFDKTTWIGWRRPLTEKDIYDMNPEDTSKELVPPFDKYFEESVEKGRRLD